MTGVVVSDKEDFKLSAGHILQGALNRQFGDTLMNEIDLYCKKGRINPEDFKTKQGQACFMEMLNFLDEDQPDHIRFEFMKKLYLGIMSDNDRDRESTREQQYMNLCRGLSSGEVITLIAAGEYTDLKESSTAWTYEDWYENLAVHCALNHSELCAFHGDKLANKRLIKQIKRGSEPEIFGLTSLGVSILQYIKTYDEASTETV
jgi:hypothetical protein